MTSMKFLIVTSPVFLVAAILLYMSATKPRWYVEPVEAGTTGTTADWKWRACIQELRSKSCGSPMEHHEALWWSTTQGGTKVVSMNRFVKNPISESAKARAGA